MDYNLSEIPEKYFEGMEDRFCFAVVYNSHVPRTEYRMAERFGTPCLEVNKVDEDYENADFFCNKIDALNMAARLSTITNRQYTLIAVLERKNGNVEKIL